MFYKEKILLVTISLICAASLLSCSSADLGRKYTPIEPGFMLESGKSIAVISGHNDDNDIQITEMVIEKLSKTGKFRVLSQSEIKKMVPRYPLNLNLIDFTIAGGKDKRYTPYLSSTSKEAIDAVHKLVKTDYILIVWIDGMGTTSIDHAAHMEMCIMSRLIWYPRGNVVGYSARLEKDSSAFGRWENFFDDASKNLVKDIIKKTN